MTSAIEVERVTGLWWRWVRQLSNLELELELVYKIHKAKDAYTYLLVSE